MDGETAERSRGRAARAARRATLALCGVVASAALFPSRPGFAAESAARPAECSSLDRVLAAAKDRFASIRGTPDDRGEGVWHATVAVPPGQDCTVYGGVVAAYTCDLYGGDREEDADDAYDVTVRMVKRCLPAGWTVKDRDDGMSTLTRARAPDGSVAVRVLSRIETAEEYLVDLWVDVLAP